VETKKQGPRSPTATQRHQFRFPPPPGTYWAQLGAPMWRYGLTDRVTARAFARRRTPQNGHAGGLGSARGAARRRKKSATEPRRDPEAPA